MQSGKQSIKTKSSKETYRDILSPYNWKDIMDNTSIDPIQEAVKKSATLFPNKSEYLLAESALHFLPERRRKLTDIIKTLKSYTYRGT